MAKNIDYFTLTSKAGRFVFPRGTRLSHAKLIRDTITAGFLGHLQDMTGRPQKAKSIQHWIQSNLNGPANHNSFEWVRV